MKALAATPVSTTAAFEADRSIAPIQGSLVGRWRACCAALFGFGASPPGEVNEHTLYDTAIMPLLWPPY